MDKVNDFNFNIELVNNYKDTERGCLFFTEDNGSGAKYIVDTITDIKDCFSYYIDTYYGTGHTTDKEKDLQYIYDFVAKNKIASLDCPAMQKIKCLWVTWCLHYDLKNEDGGMELEYWEELNELYNHIHNLNYVSFNYYDDFVNFMGGGIFYARIIY